MAPLLIHQNLLHRYVRAHANTQVQLEADLEEQTMNLTQLLQTTQQRCQALETAQQEQERLSEESGVERSDLVKELEQKLAAAEAEAAALRTQV